MLHRWTRAAWAAPLVVALTLGASVPADAAALSPAGLRMDERTDQPLGVDDTTPTFSWRLSGSGPDARQSAYRVRATDAAGAALWDSGKVAGATSRATYAGAPLTSRTRVSWQVRVWDASGEPSGWSAPSTFEIGLLSPADWGSAQWIHLPPPPLNRGVTYDVGEQEGRYVRLDVTKLGLPLYESSYSAEVSRIQLAEMQVLAPDGTNLALGRSVSAFDQFQSQGWGTRQLTDGRIISPGYMSRHLFTQDANPSKWVQVDLGSVQRFNKVVLYPRSDSRTATGQIPNFPVNFTLRTGTSSTPTTVVKTVTDQPNPPGPDLSNPLPIFARGFSAAKPVAKARLYIAGLGAYDATVNGRQVTDTVLNPGAANPMKSVEYGTYDVTSLVRSGDNTLGVALGNGQTNVNPQANAAAGRSEVYTKFNSIPVPQGTLLTPVAAGATTIQLDSVTGYAVGDTVNVDTLDGGSRLESRTVTAVGTNTLTFTPALSGPHAAGVEVLGSGARTMMAVTPRLLARLELTYADGTTDTIATDPSFKVKHGPTITDNFYAGVDFDAREVQAGWDEPGADLSAAKGWEPASLTSAPTLQTELVWREAPPVRVQKTFKPVQIKKVSSGSWSFDLGQNFAGIPRLQVKGVPAGTVIKIIPGESWSGSGAVSTASSGSPNGIFNTYTTSGDPDGETFAPTSMYHGFQYVQISGLPDSFTPDENTITGLATNGDVPAGGSVTTDNELINTVHRMAEWSIRSNMQSTFTDCPHREKLAWLADMIQSMGSIHANFDVSGHLRGMQRHMLEAQLPDGLVPGTAPEFPIFGGGYRDDVNWGGAFIITPYFLWQTYGDTRTMREYYAPMQAYLEYVRKQVGASGLLVSGLKDWIAGDTTTTAEATGTYGLYVIADQMAQMAAELGKADDAASYRALAKSLGDAFNAAFYDPARKTYPGSQAMAALPLAMGIVPADAKQSVLDSLVERIYAYHPNGTGPHMSGGTVSLQATYRVLMDNDRGDVLWDVLQQPSAPSYANFVNQGRTTIPESWDFAGSQNHMILLQIDEWFTKGLSGIRQAPGSTAYERVTVKPQAVGTLSHVAGSYETPRGTIKSEWRKGAFGVTSMKVTVPAGTAATVYVPASAGQSFVAVAGRAVAAGRVDGYQVFEVQPGSVEFQQGTSTEAGVGGTVPATLSLTFGAPATFGAFTPGVEREYTAGTTANVISTAGDAALTVSEPGHLTNGAFSLPQPLSVAFSKAAWTAPVSNDTVDITFKQRIGARDALRTGAYSRTLTFTLSTTTP